eukprot:scaffold280925_cov35-Tisochrysis_lutea.AAC.1
MRQKSEGPSSQITAKSSARTKSNNIGYWMLSAVLRAVFSGVFLSLRFNKQSRVMYRVLYITRHITSAAMNSQSYQRSDYKSKSSSSSMRSSSRHDGMGVQLATMSIIMGHFKHVFMHRCVGETAAECAKMPITTKNELKAARGEYVGIDKDHGLRAIQ